MLFSTPPRAVIFDMDGVLIDSEPLHERATRAAGAQHGIDVPPSVFEAFRGQTDAAIMAHLAEEAEGVEASALLAAKHAAYAALSDELTLMPGVRAFIDGLRERGLPLALVTSASRRDQAHTFARFGLAPAFHVVITADDVTHAKPHPAPYRQAVGQLGVDAGAALVIEDSTHGVTSACRAGCRVVGYCSSFSAEALRAAGAHHTVRRYEALARRLDAAWTQDGAAGAS